MRQRSIILVPFPFSDQSGKKVRPALILSNDSFNAAGDDLLVCAITSTLKKNDYTSIIDQKDLETGILYEKSAIKAETILRIKKSLVIKEIAVINKKIFAQVLTIIQDVLRQE